MSKHDTISQQEAANRLAILELIEAYAHCADRRDAKGQMSLFTKDTHFVVFMNAKDPTPSMDLHSREALAPVFADLNKYDATTHFIGQSTIFTLTNDRATGEAQCLAHHVTDEGRKRRLMAASLRYFDTFVKLDASWLFAEQPALCRLDGGARSVMNGPAAGPNVAHSYCDYRPGGVLDASLDRLLCRYSHIARRESAPVALDHRFGNGRRGLARRGVFLLGTADVFPKRRAAAAAHPHGARRDAAPRLPLAPLPDTQENADSPRRRDYSRRN